MIGKRKRAGSDIVDSLSHFPMIGAQLCLQLPPSTYKLNFFFSLIVFVRTEVPIVSIDRLKNDGLEPTLSNDW